MAAMMSGEGGGWCGLVSRLNALRYPEDPNKHPHRAHRACHLRARVLQQPASGVWGGGVDGHRFQGLTSLRSGWVLQMTVS